MDTNTLSPNGWGSTQPIEDPQNIKRSAAASQAEATKRQQMSKPNTLDLASVAAAMTAPSSEWFTSLYKGEVNGIRFIVDSEGEVRIFPEIKASINKLDEAIEKVEMSNGFLITMNSREIKVFQFDGSATSLDVPIKKLVHQVYFDGGTKNRYVLTFRNFYFCKSNGCLYALVQAKLRKSDLYLYVQKYNVIDPDAPQYEMLEVPVDLTEDYNPREAYNFFVEDEILFMEREHLVLNFKEIQ